ncbi:putative ATPase AAA [Candidatus Sulfopaludibacter sp. SbA4]|nr:putative ATPase AAA [Candidatus Sulfopaludibacter sp. SbA4]
MLSNEETPPAAMRPDPGNHPKVDGEKVRAQMRLWQDRVLDITKSNPLIGLNRSRVAKLQFVEPLPNQLFRNLVLEEAKLRMPLVTRRKDEASQEGLFGIEPVQAEVRVEPGDVSFDVEPIDVMRSLRRIYDNARTTVEERGVTTLFVAFGALRWRDDLFGASISPLWMVPCEFASKGPNAPLRLSIADEEMQLNPALEYYLRERHKVQLVGIPEEPDARSLARFLEQVRSQVSELQWQVTDEAWLSTFTFESLVIYQDLRALTQAAISNHVLAALARAVPAAGRSESLGHDLDALATPEVIPTPVLPTDSSQLEALAYAAAGRNVVMHGPPGTGKSQTIANLIADALSKNQKVLFVSAKMAALNVVHDRLKALGLERFCLEAHSTKAGKAKIIDELRSTMEVEAFGDGQRLKEELQALSKTRDALNSYVRALHRRVEPVGISAYQAIGRLVKRGDAPDVRTKLPWPDPTDATRADLDGCTDLLDELGSVADVFDRRREHPWRGFVSGNFGIQEQETLENALGTLLRACEAILHSAVALELLIPEASRLSIEGWAVFREPLSAIVEIEKLPDGWWLLPVESLEAKARIFDAASKLVVESRSSLASLRASSDLSVSELVKSLAPVETVFNKRYAVLRPSFWRWRRRASEALKPGISRSRRAFLKLVTLCRRLCEIELWFDSNAEGLRCLPAGRASSASEFSTVSKAYCAAAALRKALNASARLPREGTTGISPEVKTAASSLMATLPPGNTELDAALSLIDGLWPSGFVHDCPAGSTPTSAVAAKAAQLMSATTHAREWVVVQRIITKCTERGLGPFLEALGSISARVARAAFEKRFYTLWVSTAGQRHRELGEFSAARQGDLIERFRLLDERVRHLTIEYAQAVASSASQRVRAAQDHAGTAGQVGILRYELQKKKRIKPLRKLFAEIPQVLQALKPCLLMSPISVSTYLKPDAFRFDLVVFDEASQLPTAEAVPSILRADRVVVAGDPNQLPPTSFFEASLLTEADDDEEEDPQSGQPPLESLLNDCVAVVPVFQETYLRWHYRSRDERLIRFSNHYFYENHLVTFPAAVSGGSGQGVRHVYVSDGVWDRGRSRTNRREARVVAKLVVEHFDRFPERSLGVVALNVSHKESIQEAIDEEIERRPDLAPLIDTSRPDNFFVKSLENVQGDERDTMIISVGYGKDADGSVTYNFGPINRDGGWRRLNVLITRAKWECVLVTSLRAQELSGVNPNNRGAVALRNFIEYAERDGQLPADAPVPTAGETNDFEDAVRAALVERGFAVDAQVGASKYRLDLAIRDHRNPNRYILGVECDGATYHSSRSARDRDILRQEVLQRMGWRIHRVWSTDWFHNREQALTSLLRSIELAEQAPATKPVYAPATTKEAPAPTGPTAAPRPLLAAEPRRYRAGEAYRKVSPASRGRREYLLEAEHADVLASIICEIAGAEGPIAKSLLTDRVKELNCIERAGSNVQANIDSATSRAVRAGSIELLQGGEFIRAKGQAPTTFRVPAQGVKRTIDQISNDEIGLAVLHIVEDQFGVSEEYMPQAVARVFGIERLRSEAGEKIREVVESLIKRGLLRVTGTQVYLA